MARNPPLTYRLAFLGVFALLATSAASTSIAPTPTAMDSATAVFPRQAPTTNAPGAPKSDLRALLSPKLDVIINGDDYPVPASESVALLQPDGASITLQPSAVVANGQSSPIPSVSSATGLTVGGIGMTVQPSRFLPPTGSTLDSLKSLSNIAGQIEDQINTHKPTLESFGNGQTSIDDLQGQFMRDMDSLVDLMDQFDSRLQGLAAASSTPRDSLDLLDNMGPAAEAQIADAYPKNQRAISYTRDMRNLIKIGSRLPAAVLGAARAYATKEVVLALEVGGAAMATFKLIDWTAAAATQTSLPGTATTSTSSTTSETPTLYWLSSKPYSIKKEDFDDYCRKLDGGNGFFDSRPGNPKQGYQAELTLSKVAQVKKEPWFDFIEPVVDLGVDDDDAENYRYIDRERLRQNDTEIENEASTLAKRALVKLPGAAPQLKLLSAQPDKGPIDKQDFYSDNLEGEDVTIYIIDDGFDLNARELDTDGRRIDNYIVPNDVTFPEKVARKSIHVALPQNINGPPDGDKPGHGTQVAIAAAGAKFGVAARANLMLVKAKATVKSPDSTGPVGARYQLGALQDAISHIQAHIRNNGRQTRAVVNMSFGLKAKDGHKVEEGSGLDTLFKEFEEWCRDNDVVWVIAAGNKLPEDKNAKLGDGIPQRLGSPTNAIITVGGVDENGVEWSGSVPEGSNPMNGEVLGTYSGSITVHAQARKVKLNLALKSDSEPKEVDLDGTSLAAPQVAGLAAYFLRKRPGGRPFGGKTAALRMKTEIQNLAVHWPGAEDNVHAANNGARGRDQYLCRRSPPDQNPVDGCGLPPPKPPGPPPGVTCDLPGTIPNQDPQSYPEGAFAAAAHQFCYGGYNWEADPATTGDGYNWSATNYYWFDTTSIDPATNLPAYCIGAAYGDFDQWAPPSRKLCKSPSPPGLENSDSKVWIQVIRSPSQEGCSPLKKYKLPEGDQCVKNFMNVINACMPVDKGGKSGVWKESTPFGCFDWWLWGRQLT